MGKTIENAGEHFEGNRAVLKIQHGGIERPEIRGRTDGKGENNPKQSAVQEG